MMIIINNTNDINNNNDTSNEQSITVTKRNK